jgi:uncharacterized membrane protein YfcA
MKKKIFTVISGFFAGILNGLLGAGGGMIIVPILEKSGLDKKECHATSIFTILPLSIISSAVYMIRGDVKINDALIFIPFGIIGAIIGAKFLKKIKITYLRFAFALILLYSGVRMFI